MTCNCGNKKVVRHVRGNTLTLAIPLQERIRRMVDDEETVETVDYNPLPTDVVTVNLRGFTRTVTFSGTDVTITGNVVEVTDKGTLGAGTYGVEILIDSADGKKRRYYSASEIQVVEQTRDAGIDEGTEYDVTTRTLEAAVFDMMRGYSAYEIWLQQGHEGTEADFLEWLRDDNSMAGEYIDNGETITFYRPKWGECNILKNPVKLLNIIAEGISEVGAVHSTLIFKAAANLSLSVMNASHVSTIQQGSPKFIEGNCYVMHFVGVRNEDDATTHVVCWFDSKLATVAYTGSYNDLEDKPTIPVLPELATVAQTGDYNDLTNKPTIPDVTGKADKVASATNGHLAGLDESGNPTDSGIVPSTLIYQGADEGEVPSVSFDPESDTVHVTAQTLSAAQKQQARENIGAAGVNDIVGIPIVNHGTSDTGTSSAPYSIAPNALHVWGEVAALYISLTTGEVGYVQEYMIQFTSGSTATVLELPSSLEWINGVDESSIEADATYQISIMNGVGVIGKVGSSSSSS